MCVFICVCLKEDYDELLKYAIVVPTYNPTNTLRATLPEVKSTVASAPPLSASAAISTGSGVMHQPSFAADTTSSATAQKPTGMKNGRHTMKAQTLGWSLLLWFQNMGRCHCLLLSSYRRRGVGISSVLCNRKVAGSNLPHSAA